MQEALSSNWVAPLGPLVDRFECEFASKVGVAHAAAVSSGTAALHLALRLSGIGPGDSVAVSTLTFAASAYPVVYQGAQPIFIDSERTSWNMDPSILAEALTSLRREGRLPKAVIVVHLYGQCANIRAIDRICREFGVVLIEDAAEALGSTHYGRAAGSFGQFGMFSFNGNKVITTSGGGMLVSDDGHQIAEAKRLASQARDPAPHYQHSAIGYNYRLSNVLAGIGLAQLSVLDARIAARRANFTYYQQNLGDLPGLEFMPEANWGIHTRWLTTLLIDPAVFGATREGVRLALAEVGIEARPVWKPMHLQPVFRESRYFGGTVADHLFSNGLCLPSGSNLTETDLEEVVEVIRGIHARSR